MTWNQVFPVILLFNLSRFLPRGCKLLKTGISPKASLSKIGYADGAAKGFRKLQRQATIRELDIAAIKGISEQEAAGRLATEGYNELPSGRRRSVLDIALDVVREPMFILLIAAGALYLLLGDLEEALLLLMFVFVIMGITFYQERKTEHALEALRDLSSPRARVIRDGEVKRIAGRDVVRGDTLVVEEGDRVPADAVLSSCINLSIDESLLTGESMPATKCAGAG